MNHLIKPILWGWPLAILLASCASEPERPDPPKGYLATYIEEDGTKKFQYTIDVPEAKERRGNGRPGNMKGHASGSSSRGVSGGVTAGTGRGHSRGTGSGNNRLAQINGQLEKQLERELKSRGFCHGGHRETARVVEPETVYIRGECEDKATDDDRARYPNNED